ncbi:hypothetical protein C8R46DRAFT_1140735 [Mycena filopes]|nr:hypothetical protein C8R46DRAFT_1140735 [Mycena filopes]
MNPSVWNFEHKSPILVPKYVLEREGAVHLMSNDVHRHRQALFFARRLDRRDRAICRIAHVHGWPVAAIADIFNVDPNTVKAALENKPGARPEDRSYFYDYDALPADDPRRDYEWAGVEFKKFPSIRLKALPQAPSSALPAGTERPASDSDALLEKSDTISPTPCSPAGMDSLPSNLDASLEERGVTSLTPCSPAGMDSLPSDLDASLEERAASSLTPCSPARMDSPVTDLAASLEQHSTPSTSVSPSDERCSLSSEPASKASPEPSLVTPTVTQIQPGSQQPLAAFLRDVMRTDLTHHFELLKERGFNDMALLRTMAYWWDDQHLRSMLRSLLTGTEKELKGRVGLTAVELGALEDGIRRLKGGVGGEGPQI